MSVSVSELKNNENVRATISNNLLTIQIMQISSRRPEAALRTRSTH